MLDESLLTVYKRIIEKQNTRNTKMTMLVVGYDSKKMLKESVGKPLGYEWHELDIEFAATIYPAALSALQNAQTISCTL